MQAVSAVSLIIMPIAAPGLVVCLSLAAPGPAVLAAPGALAALRQGSICQLHQRRSGQRLDQIAALLLKGGYPLAYIPPELLEILFLIIPFGL